MDRAPGLSGPENERSQCVNDSVTNSFGHSEGSDGNRNASGNLNSPSLGLTEDVGDWSELGRRVLSESLRRASNDWRRRNSALDSNASTIRR